MRVNIAKRIVIEKVSKYFSPYFACNVVTVNRALLSEMVFYGTLRDTTINVK